MPSAATSSAAAESAVAIARDFLDALARGDTTAAEALEDATMRQAAPAAALSTLWSQLEAQFGAFGAFGAAESAAAAPYTNVTVQASFANAIVPLIVTVTTEGLIAGLHLGNPAPIGSPGSPSSSAPPPPSPAAYVRPESFTETEVTVGAEPWVLPGHTLDARWRRTRSRRVVLLAGSGPNDRDETIGPNAPLRDIAWGLASDGIAVLRYDKRTKTHAAEMAADVATITVKEETVDDAVAAVDLLRSTPGVDPDRVFVVGHSLGGYLAPRVAAAAPGKVAGDRPPRGQQQPASRGVILDQFEYLASEAGGADPAAAAQLDDIRAQVALAESPALSASTPADVAAARGTRDVLAGPAHIRPDGDRRRVCRSRSSSPRVGATTRCRRRS